MRRRAQELPQRAAAVASLRDALPDVMAKAAKEVNGIEATMGAYADNDDVESFK